MIRRGSSADVVDVRWEVLRPGRPRETAIFPGDDAGFHWVDEEAGQVLAVASVIPAPWPAEPLTPTSGLQLRGMAVSPAVRGTGRGAMLLVAIQRDLAAPLWCNARADVLGFYARFGWRVRGGPFDVPAVGPHHRMTWSPP